LIEAEKRCDFEVNPQYEDWNVAYTVSVNEQLHCIACRGTSKRKVETVFTSLVLLSIISSLKSFSQGLSGTSASDGDDAGFRDSPERSISLAAILGCPSNSDI
jgi:hypothetical protein